MLRLMNDLVYLAIALPEACRGVFVNRTSADDRSMAWQWQLSIVAIKCIIIDISLLIMT